MSENIVIVCCSEICEGKLEELKAAMAELVELVKAKEPRMIAYNVYLNENDTQLTVLQVHPDSGSAEFHMEVTGSAFTTAAKFIDLSRIDIYGKPSQSLLDKMSLSQMTGRVTTVVHELSAGFSRFWSPGPTPPFKSKRFKQPYLNSSNLR